MNFKEMRERADNLEVGADAIRDLRRALNDLDSAIDSIRDVYSDLDSAIDDLNMDGVEEFVNDIVAMEEPKCMHYNPVTDAAYVWRIAGALLLCSSNMDVDIVREHNEPVFWASLSRALVNYPPYRTTALTYWLTTMFPTGV